MMTREFRNRLFPTLKVMLAVCTAIITVGGLLALIHGFSSSVNAAPIPPPEGYPKLRFSIKSVSPTLAGTGGSTLQYVIEVINTGAYTATGAYLADLIPTNTTYNGDAQVSDGPPPTFSNGLLEWTGDIGFDATVVMTFSVTVEPAYAGIVQNTAVINQALLSKPVTLTADTMVTDEPILAISKNSSPAMPGPGHPLTYNLVVTNEGQPAVNLPITVTDFVPANTALRSLGPDGSASPSGDVVTWTRTVNLGWGETTSFYFSVDVQSVPSGTVLLNDNYQVRGQGNLLGLGEVHTTTVSDPDLAISKHVWPDPPGSNRELTYTISVLNKGSLATGLIITDRVPSGVTYLGGGSFSNGVVFWSLPRLETGQRADFSFTAAVGDIAEVGILNNEYGVCTAEGICLNGPSLLSYVLGPTFEVNANLDPIAKKPGGGTGTEVTPTLTLHNSGPGNALDASALLIFGRISVGDSNDLIAIPPVGSFSPGPDCGSHCVAYRWVGDIGVGDTITFTTDGGQSTIGGSEGTNYTATLVVSDTLGTTATDPFSGSAIGIITHKANLLPKKSAPPVIGRGLPLTYTITVLNTGLSADAPPDAPHFPWLTDAVPPSTTLVSISDGGIAQDVDGTTVISWTLPALSTGESLTRKFTVLVDADLISGTQIINQDYHTYWYEIQDSATLSNTGQPVTTTVREVGLIDSFKVVTPTLARPGPGNVLTHTVHIVNTSPNPLNGVTVYDRLPWQNSTYQRDAVASSGLLTSDIVSISWTGDLAPFSSEVITFTVVVDPDYEGPITNTASISHSSLLEDLEVTSVAYITDDPVLRIAKSAAPDPVVTGGTLVYTIRVSNLGQQATELDLYDLLPANTQFVPGSATSGGQLVGDQIRWNFLALEPGETRTFSFRVIVSGISDIVNAQYWVNSDEGASAVGEPLVTRVIPSGGSFLPLIFK